MRVSAWIAGLAVAVSLNAAPALAGDPVCLWKAAPQSARDAILAKGEAGIPQGADIQAFLSSLHLGANGTRCGVRLATPEAPIMALTGYLYEVTATRWLEAHKAATRAELETGWTTMDPVLRQSVIDNAAALSKSPLPEQALPDFVQHTGVSGLDPATVRSQPYGAYLLAYMAGRALRAAYENKP
jgi:hypothetical protein